MTVYLGLGSNLSDRFGNLCEAVHRLEHTSGIHVTNISHIYETDPVGVPEQPNYLNAAVEIETDLGAHELLTACLNIEKEMGRTRHERWSPRTIDIDLLLYGDSIITSSELSVPHPLLQSRGFVLYPLSDIAPDRIHPVIGLTVNELKDQIKKTGIRKMDDLTLEM